MPNFDTREDKMRHLIRSLRMALLLAAAVGWLSVQAHAGVKVFDQVTVVDEAVFLKIRTSGLIFPSGGKRIRLQIAHQETHTLLSGADGFAFHRIRPREPGLVPITATADSEQDQGWVLVLAKEQPTLLVEIDPALRTSPFSAEARQGSRTAIEQLQARYGLVYLTRWLWTDRLKQWLARTGFAKSVLIRWEGRRTAERLKARGIHIAAAIGSSDLLEELPGTETQRFAWDSNTAEPSKGQWSAILEELLPEGD